MGTMDSASLLPVWGDKEQRPGNWNLVIKVRYDGILKRFKFSIRGQQTNTEYDMDKLKAKISDIFNFCPDEVLVFTYTDEDGDEINLDKDEELYDAVISQKLNPLRINVQLKSQSTNGSNFKQNASTNSECDSGDIFDKNSPETVGQLKFNLEESLKSIPEPLRSAFGVLSPEALQVVLASQNFSQFLVLLSNLQGSNTEFKASIKRTELIDFPKPSSSKSPENGNMNSTDEQMKDIEFHRRKEKALADPVAVGDNTSMKNIYQSNPNIHSPMLKERKLINQRIPCDLTTLYPINPMLSIQTQKGSTSHANALQNKTQYPTTFPLHSPVMYPYKNSSGLHGIYPHYFHRGIICSGCGMNPIIGPRYKSSLEEFDLCSTCFHCVSGRTNFTKIDWPIRFPKETIDNDDHHSHIFSNLSPRMKIIAPPKLDSCFIRDLSIWDGTVVSPSSPFTKIWRMQNNGNIPWPIGTQLVRIRGDYLNGHDSIKLEIPEKGIPVEEELDIAIDLISPSTLGRYKSYWQMVSPIGNKFGEEIWVIIEVDDAHSDSSSYGTYSLFNSNFPSQTGINVIESNEYNDEHMECLTENQKANELVNELLKPDSPDILSLQALKIPSFLKCPNDSQSSSLSCAIKGSHFNIPTSSSPFPPIPAPSTLILKSFHQDDNPPLTYAEVVAKPFPDVLIAAPPVYIATDFDEDAEEFMLREMEEIGIVPIDQKKQFVGNPCAFTESDARLENLQEPGFVDGDVSPNRNTNTMPQKDNLPLIYAEMVAKPPPDVPAAASCSYVAADSESDAEEFMPREMEEIGIVQIKQRRQSVSNPYAFTESIALLEDLRELLQEDAAEHE